MVEGQTIADKQTNRVIPLYWQRALLCPLNACSYTLMLGLSIDVQALGGNQYERRFQPTTQTNKQIKGHLSGFEQWYKCRTNQLLSIWRTATNICINQFDPILLHFYLLWRITCHTHLIHFSICSKSKSAEEVSTMINIY